MPMNLDLIAFRPEEPSQPRIDVSSSIRRIDETHVDVVVCIELDPGVHLFASPAPDGCEEVEVAVAPVEGITVGQPRYPVPSAPVDGAPAYIKSFEIEIPVTFAAEQQPTLQVDVRYQACTEAACFPPQVEQLLIDLPQI